MYRVIKFVCKISDIFPPAGGAIGAVSQTKNIMSYLPTWESIVAAIIISFIGACVGYLVKLIFDIVFRRIKEKYHCK